MSKGTKIIKSYGELFFILALLAFSVFMLVNAFSIRGLSSATDSAGPSLMPKVVFGVMTGLLIILTFDFWARKKSLPEKEENPEKEKIERNRGLIAAGGILLFVFLMDKLGFFLSAVIYLLLEFFLLGPKERRRPVLWITLAVVFSFAVYYLFRYQVYVKLPKGILG